MNVKPQVLALHALICDRIIDVITFTKSQWYFDRSLGDVYYAAMVVISEKGDMSREAVADAIRSQGWSQNRVACALGALSEVSKPCGYDLAFLPDQMSLAYRGSVEESLASVLNDSNTTAAQRIDAIALAHEALTHVGDSKKAPTVHELIIDFFDGIDKGEDTKKKQAAIPINDPVMRRAYGNVLWPDLYILAGRPKFGKTQMALNLVSECSKSNKRIRVHSLEDSQHTFRDKYLSLKTGTHYYDISIGGMSKEVVQHMKIRSLNLFGKNVVVDDRSYTPQELLRTMRKEIIADGIGMFVIDYAQRLRYRKADEMSELADLTKGLADLTKEYLVNVVLLSQVNERQQDTDGRVRLHAGNLFGSSSLEFDSRMIAMIDGWPDRPVKRMQWVKESYRGLQSFGIEFHHPTGKLVNVCPWEHGE